MSCRVVAVMSASNGPERTNNFSNTVLKLRTKGVTVEHGANVPNE